MFLNKHYIALRGDINYAVVAVHTDRAGIHNIQAVEIFGILIMSVTEKDDIGISSFGLGNYVFISEFNIIWVTVRKENSFAGKFNFHFIGII